MNTLRLEKRNVAVKTNTHFNHGDIPGIVFGPALFSMPVKMRRNDIKKAINKKGELYKIQSQKGSYVATFEELQRDPVTGDIIHFSMKQLPEKEKNQVELKINFEGTPKGVETGGNLLIIKDKLTVEGMIKDIPKELKVNVEDLKIGDKITVSDIKTSAQINTMEGSDDVIAVCSVPTKEIKMEVPSDLEPLNQNSRQPA